MSTAEECNLPQDSLGARDQILIMMLLCFTNIFVALPAHWNCRTTKRF